MLFLFLILFFAFLFGDEKDGKLSSYYSSIIQKEKHEKNREKTKE